MTNTITKIALAALALTAAFTGAASAQDYNDWSTISPWGLEMVDQFGNTHYVDPFAYDSQVDINGNVVSNYYGQMDPTIGMYDLTPAWTNNTYESFSYLDTNPYAGSTDSQGQFLEMIWE